MENKSRSYASRKGRLECLSCQTETEKRGYDPEEAERSELLFIYQKNANFILSPNFEICLG